MLHRLLAMGFVCLLLLVPLKAQEMRFRYDLEQCIEYALTHQVDIKNVQIEVYQAQAQVNQYLPSGFPQTSGGANTPYLPQIPVTVLPGELNFIEPGKPAAVQFGLPWQGSAGISLSQLAVDGTFFIGIKAAKELVTLYRKNTLRTQEETALAVSKAYYSALISRESLNTLDANLARVKKLYDDTKALNESGFVEKIDVDRLQITLANLNIQRLRTEGFVELNHDLLKFQMGMPVEAKLELVESVEDVAISPVPIEDILAFDPANRVEYGIVKKQHELQTYNLRRYRAGYYPTLYALAGLNVNVFGQEFSSLTQDRWYPSSNVGLQLNIPIFDGMNKRNKVAEVKLELKKIENSIEVLENSITLELKSTSRSLRDAYINLEALRNNAELAARIFHVADIKYKEGVGSSLELNDADSQLKESESSYLSGLLEYLLAKVDYQKARGEFARYHQE